MTNSTIRFNSLHEYLYGIALLVMSKSNLLAVGVLQHVGKDMHPGWAQGSAALSFPLPI